MNDSLYEQSSTSGLIDILLYLIGMVFVIAFMVFIFSTMWKFHTKAGRPGWAWLVPIYNIYTLVKIAGRPGWWTLLYFIPIVNIVIGIIIAIDTAHAFGKSSTFGVVGLFFFSLVGYAIIAHDNSTYTQPLNG